MPGAPELPEVHLSTVLSQDDLLLSTESPKKHICGPLSLSFVVGCGVTIAAIFVIIVALDHVAASMSTSDASTFVLHNLGLVAINVILGDCGGS